MEVEARMKLPGPTGRDHRATWDPTGNHSGPQGPTWMLPGPLGSSKEPSGVAQATPEGGKDLGNIDFE